MCGITGYFGHGTRETLLAMNETLRHRGPDAGGVALCNSDAVGLGHRRLSIVDLSEAGAQPMYSDDRQVVIVFNGEIFNYKELHQQYLANESFNGTSDTEVILRLYLKLGIAAFTKLRGMYAIALYDGRSKQLHLVRDPHGKKPLYWTKTASDTLIFGSELKALFKHPDCPRELDKTAIAEYLTFEYVPAPRTIIEGIAKLPGGHCLTYDGKEVALTPVEYDTVADLAQYGDTPQAQFMGLMDGCVAERLNADVPVGVFLSGGLDSSTVAYFAQKQHPEKIKTFSIGFTDPTFDEQDHARLVAKHLDTDHHSLLLGTDEIKGIIADLPQILDEPIADSSIVPTTLVSRFAREQVTVTLSGDGADELFHGYSTFYAHKLAKTYGKLPQAVQRGVQYAANHLPVSHSYMSFDFKLKRFVLGMASEPRYRNALWLSAFTPEEVADLSDGQLPTEGFHTVLDSWYANRSLDEGLQTEYLEGFLTEDILVKVDRASMAHSLEVRSPFLDERMVQFALGLDERWKLHGRTGKYLIKSTMSPYLPKEVVWKPKKGFNMPIGKLIKGELKDEFSTAILDGPLTKTGLFNRDKLATLLQQHWDNKVDHRKRIWTLYVLARWLDTWSH